MSALGDAHKTKALIMCGHLVSQVDIQLHTYELSAFIIQGVCQRQQREKDWTLSKESIKDLEANTYQMTQIRSMKPTAESKGFEVSKKGKLISCRVIRKGFMKSSVVERALKCG